MSDVLEYNGYLGLNFTILHRLKGSNSCTTGDILMKLNVHICVLMMYYYSQSDKTRYASLCYSNIFKFHGIPFRGYLVMANFMDFKSIQGL